MVTGKVKFFNPTKGFGFILADDGSGEFFVHSTKVIGEIHDNEAVSFEIGEGRKGPEAINVQAIGGEEQADMAMAA
jgi:CspA family cold shock protein